MVVFLCMFLLLHGWEGPVNVCGNKYSRPQLCHCLTPMPTVCSKSVYVFCAGVLSCILLACAGALEQAMQVAESQGVLSSSDEVHISSNNSDSKYTRNEGRPEKGKAKGNAQGNLQGNKRQDSLPQVTGCKVAKTLLANAGELYMLLLCIVFTDCWGGRVDLHDVQQQKPQMAIDCKRHCRLLYIALSGSDCNHAFGSADSGRNIGQQVLRPPCY